MFTDADPVENPGHEADGVVDHFEAAPATEFQTADLVHDPDLEGSPVDRQSAAPESVDTGHLAPDIVYTSANGTETDLGAPTEDLDGDGVAESVAVHTADGDILVLSDTNADGHPDQMIQIDPTTGSATWAVPDGHGGWDVVQTGHVDPDGSLVVDHAAAGPDPDDNLEVAVDGRSFDAGPATIDSDGDGVPDTVAVAGPGGSTLYYQDTNGDGVADKAWTTDPSGHVTANYTLANDGTWVPTGSAS